MKMKKMAVVSIMAFLVASGAVFGQQAAPEGERGRRERTEREGRTIDPEQMQERYMERIKSSLEVSDEEWQVIRPRVEAVRTAQMSGRQVAMRGRARQESEVEMNRVQKATQELREVLSDTGSSATEVAGKLKALREARKQSESELEKARIQLRELLTQRQEAQLVLMGILD